MRDVYIESLKTFVENGRVQEALEPDYLIAQLRNKGIINEGEAEKIMAKNSRLIRQKELLVDILTKLDDEAFDGLLETMDSEHYNWARSLLQAIVVKETKKTDKKKPKQPAAEEEN